HGCTDTSNKKKVVILPPKAQFTYTLSCKNYYTVEFINTSKGADSVVWLFGDGKKDSLNKDTIFHTYPSRGPFTASLTAYNYSSGCNNTFTGTFTIAEPIASFTVTNASGCYPFATTFTSTSQDANSVFWNFGDPASTTDTSNVVNPSYTYNTPAAYSASLIITDVNGCKDTVKHTTKALGPIPYFYATKLTGCRPLTVTFRDTSHDDSTKVQWAWNFGDGTPVVVTNTDTVTHIYTVPGNYNVTDSVRDKNGCVKGLTISNYIKPTFPFPKFTVDTFSCKNNLLTFYDSTVAVGGHYLWHFGDGGTSTLQSPTHAYTSDGLYIVLLTVTDTNSCRDSIQDTIRILKPTANFSFTIGSVNCGNMLVNFTDQSSGFVNGWNWDFGNGGTSTAQNPTASYTSGGIYNVTLIVTNRGGCKDTLKLDSLVVVPFPVGTFSFFPQTGCTPLNVQFASSSMNTISYGWNFGDGTFVTNGNTISHLYTNPGTFSPLLFLQDTLPNGMPCVKTVLAPYPVIVTNVINVSLSGPNVVTVPKDSILSVNANYSGGAPPYTFSWTPDTAINCNTCPSIMIVGTGDTIVYTFTIIDKNGCLGKDSIIVLSEPCSEKKLIPNVFTPNGDGKNDMFYIPGVCPGEKYSLQIFDRWGTLMFSTTLRNNGWDGRNTSGVEASNGTYYYVVKIDNSNGQNASTITEGPIAYPSYTVTHKDGVEIIKGFVELLR
ncbi:MAG TPA: PKD domain-containing protein, partial [Bacteroidia bacterium]